MNVFKSSIPFERKNINTIFYGGLRLKGIVKKGSNSQPLVSYITAALNSKSTILKTIQSVQSQSYCNVEHIIIDGGSTDGTLQLIHENEDKIDYYISEKDFGVYSAFNKGVCLANGEIICILNSDDWLISDSAINAVKLLKNKHALSILCTSALVHDVDRGGYVWNPITVDAGSYFTCANVCHNAIYATRGVYSNVGLYAENFKIAGDFDWIMRCYEQKINFIYSNELTVNYAKGGISSDILTHCKECICIAKTRFPFLDNETINGLFFIFFGQMKVLGPKLGVKPPDHFGRFLKDVLQKNASQADFVNALAWSAVGNLIHPKDMNWYFCLKRLWIKFLENIKVTLLAISPRLYRLIKKINNSKKI
jgi:glycosyltransferase involved in cell wall biosynthesis